MVAFHYPPYKGGSGVHRTSKLANFLPDHGWLPTVLTATHRAYPNAGNAQLDQGENRVRVIRAFALDTARHISFRNSYPRFLALPDRWASWWPNAVFAGLHLIRKEHPAVIWSTYPIATAHLIGLTLHRLTGTPWVADFRDPMTDFSYPPEPSVFRCYRWIERQTVQHSDRLIFTTESTRKMYLNRFPELTREKSIVIHNGYDENDFKDLPFPGTKLDNEPMRLVHAGALYPEERDPRPFFGAVTRLKQEGRLDAVSLRIELRATGVDSYYESMIRDYRIEDIVHLLPALPYRQALEDCASADGLLLFQAASCNHQIPAKVYEYLRLRRPILALTPGNSDTAVLLAETGGATITDIADEDLIYNTLPNFLSALMNNSHSLPDMNRTQCYTRKSQATEFASCFSSLSGK